MTKKKFFINFKGGLILMLISLFISSCDKKGESNEPQINNKDIYGKWQQYEVVAEDNSYVPGNPDIIWIFNSDGSFQCENSGVIRTTGTYQIVGTLLTIYSHSVENSNFMEHYSGEFILSHGLLYYDYFNLRTGDEYIQGFKKMK